jgi:hypothetical protein
MQLCTCQQPCTGHALQGPARPLPYACVPGLKSSATAPFVHPDLTCLPCPTLPPPALLPPALPHLPQCAA